MLRHPILACAVAAVLSADAQADPMPVGMQGAGMATCAEYAKQYAAEPLIDLHYFSWAQGYIAATNVQFGSRDKWMLDLSSIPVEAQQTSIRSYCDKHPLAQYYSAVTELISKFKTTRAIITP
ncbi:MAG TPA: hypothetical protein VKS60_24905 [Stellaceae bacterium]|nr:hypothetical protein [Stellaceae bacterium]